jgi:hypothetical protein
MTRLNIRVSLDRFGHRADDAAGGQRLLQFAHAVTEDRLLQVLVAVAVASLWLSLAFGDLRFLVLLGAAGVAIRRFRQLEREFVPDDDDLL